MERRRKGKKVKRAKNWGKEECGEEEMEIRKRKGGRRMSRRKERRSR